MKQDQPVEPTAWLRDQRHRAINVLLGLIVICGPLGLLPGLINLFRGEGFSLTLRGYLVAYAFAVVLFVYRRIDDRWRALGLLLLAYGFAVFALYSGWLAGSGRVLLLSFIIMAALLVSTEAGLIAAGLSVLTYVAFGLAFGQGLITLPELPDPTSFPPIIIEGVGFLLVTGTIALIPWFFGQALAAASRANQEAQRAERLLAEHAAQLEAANDELEAFAYSVSHDLRAPLRAVDSFSQILLDDYASQFPPEAQRYLGVVHDNAQRMGEMIKDLLTFSRLGWQELRKQTVSPQELVEQVLGDLSTELEGRQVELVVDQLPPCQADPGLLRQVYANLLSNALKFTREREVARIEVGSEEGEGEVVYYVRDNGVGFDMRYAHKLFGVFQRLHGTQEYEGTGVGLAIVQRIVHRHGGRLWADAEVSRGATFYFTLEEGTTP